MQAGGGCPMARLCAVGWGVGLGVIWGWGLGFGDDTDVGLEVGV